MMSNQYQPLFCAKLAFDDGVPFNPQYGDVYHSRSGALAQARHVFLSGNGLPGRWQAQEAFTIVETGFGTGNNFLATWHAWRLDAHRCRRLHFVSVEGHPFDAADMRRLADGVTDPEVRVLAQQLAEKWPLPVPGMHRLDFEQGRVSLTLAFGPIQLMAKQLQASADAFFLDGFAPDRNPEMWTRELFGQLVRIARQGATAATWCTAVAVRRALSAAGFLVSKAPGFARKREMTVAVLRPNLGRLDNASAAADTSAGSVAIIGAGFAGAAVAHALALRGIRPVVFDPAFKLGAHVGHRGHRAAAMSPVLTPDDDTRSRLSRAGILLAQRRWGGLADEAARPRTCGTLEIAVTAQDAARKAMAVRQLQLPASWVQWLDEGHALQLAGMSGGHGGLFFPQGKVVKPGPLVHALLAQAEHQARAVGALRQQPDRQWQLLDRAGNVMTVAGQVILANAAHAPVLLARSGVAVPSKLAAMECLPGQIAQLRALTHEPAPRVILAGHGYWLPPEDGVCTVGSTYGRKGELAEVSQQGFLEILQKLAVLSGISCEALRMRLLMDKGWAGLRAALADHLPVVGPVQAVEGLWLSCGFGSRALSWAPLAGEVIACQMLQEPLPLERELQRRIAPR